MDGALASSTKSKLDELERAITQATVKHERSKDRCEKLSKILLNAKAGIQHLCDKLSDVKVAGYPDFGHITDTNMVEALVHCERKLRSLYSQVRSDPAFEEALQIIRGVVLPRKDDDFRPQRPGSANRASVMRQTGLGFHPGASKVEASNIRVRLIQDGDDEDLSEPDNDIDMDGYERAKIKRDAARKRELSNSKRK